MLHEKRLLEAALRAARSTRLVCGDLVEATYCTVDERHRDHRDDRAASSASRWPSCWTTRRKPRRHHHPHRPHRLHQRVTKRRGASERAARAAGTASAPAAIHAGQPPRAGHRCRHDPGVPDQHLRPARAGPVAVGVQPHPQPHTQRAAGLHREPGGWHRTGCASAAAWRPSTRCCARCVPGDRVLCGDDVYGGTYRLFTTGHREVRHPLLDFANISDPDVEVVPAEAPPWSGPSRRPTRC